ncbi:MAG: hypothetical protein AAB799_00760 [Patescibacteria group bacterium]|mgnify:CR=1 FL=1
MLRKLLVLAFLIVPTLSFGQDNLALKHNNPPRSYIVTIWSEKFEDFTSMDPEKWVYYNNFVREISVEFRVNSLIFDLDTGLMKIGDLSYYAVTVKDAWANMPLVCNESCSLDVDLGEWSTVRVVERVDNGRIYIFTWYRKVFDKDKKVWSWEVVSQIRQ